MTIMALDIHTPQKGSLIPEAFQESLVTNMTGRLLSDNAPPCLLRAPTGSGKTFVLSRTLAQVSARRKVVWFWFVPFTTLVNQTLDALVTNATDLTPTLFTQGINQNPAPGQVLISTLQGVSRAAWRRKDYDAGGGEVDRTPAEFAGLCRGQEFEIGVVIDEAHIALDEATEFGHFIRWLNPAFLTMATATPRSQRINQFLASAGMSSFEGFNVSRDEVVTAKLNKAYVEAVIYQLRETTATVADLKRTVLRQSWLRNQTLKTALQGAGVDLNPLLLVQVENGPDSIDNAERDLVHLCGVSPLAIGKHSSDTPNPEMMDAIANDTTKEVLIFKQSAGTGFDAPRAFVLASLKSVNDADFAMQFIGRVMRVAREIRKVYPGTNPIPADFNTAYIYLANAEAQQGYQQAVQVTNSVRTSLEGEVEKMVERRTRGGHTVITNRPTPQPDLDSHTPLPERTANFRTGTVSPASGANSPSGGQMAPEEDDATRLDGTLSSGTSVPVTGQASFFEDQAKLDTVDWEAACSKRHPDPRTAHSVKEWEAMMRDRGISVYYLDDEVPQSPTALKREDRPGSLDMANIAQRVATRLTVPDRHMKDAILATRNRLRERERHTELTTGKLVGTENAHIVIDRNIIANEALTALSKLPQIELADHKILLETLAGRVLPHLKEHLADVGDTVSDTELQRMTRTSAQWIVRVLVPEIEEALYTEIAAHADLIDAAPLPNAMLFPVDIALPRSDKNLYGILPPSAGDLAAVEQTLVLEDRALMRDETWRIDGQQILTGRFDTTFSLNNDERAFADALDRAPFVTWWFRNPDKKPYSVRLVRGEHRNYFYPDFVVCLEHVDGQPPLQRLVETKHDLKDARRKAKHIPDHFGKVLFLTKDHDRLHVVTDEGGVGDVIDLGDLETLRSELQKTAP